MGVFSKSKTYKGKIIGNLKKHNYSKFNATMSDAIGLILCFPL